MTMGGTVTYTLRDGTQRITSILQTRDIHDFLYRLLRLGVELPVLH